jgi:hypothetical protein
LNHFEEGGERHLEGSVVLVGVQNEEVKELEGVVVGLVL